MPDLFKEVMPSIMHYKNNVFHDDKEIEEYFNKNFFIINKVLSMYMDCVPAANYLNIYNQLPGKLKHDFLLNIIRGYKRPFNYAKTEKMEDLDIIKEYYCVGNVKAKEYHSLLTHEQLDLIRKKLFKGGLKK